MVYKMESYLFCWIGFNDLKASRTPDSKELGPIGQVAVSRHYDHIVLLANYSNDDVKQYIDWLGKQTVADIQISKVELTSPTNFGEIYKAVVSTLNTYAEISPDHAFTYHLSPGTGAMSAVWLLLANSSHPAALIESSLEAGVKDTVIPFDISAEFIPDRIKQSDQTLQRLTTGLPPDAPEFEHIIHQSEAMKRVVARARRVALRSIPVLIEGESGTGKELFARAIHKASTRKNMPFISVNCGAIPKELVESMLFGHKKGSFTGANTDHKGYFEEADSGTLFLDEIGELPLEIQVRLLRVIQESEVVRVGEVQPRKIDIRIIAATNRSLVEEIQNKRFREDLYYRIAVAVIKLPALREREGDLALLIDKLVDQVNKESESEPGYKHKKISAKAKNIMLNHSWPGNVRELLNTLRSAAIWSDGDKITEHDINDAMLHLPKAKDDAVDVLNRDLSQGIDLKDIISNVARHYLTRALDESKDNKTKAAKLLGLGNYQTFTNWVEKYGLEK